MIPISTIRVLAILEASSVTGPAKAVLEFAREASQDDPLSAKIELSVTTFSCSPVENSLTAAIRRAGIELDIISERHAFDGGVLPQLQTVVKSRKPDVIWTNSVKSHFLVRLAGLNRSAKWVAFHHGYTATDTKMRIYNQLDRWSLRAADRVLTVCGPFAHELQSISVTAGRIRVQHMPIRPFEPVTQDRISDLRRQLGIPCQTQVLLSVGRLSFEKGHGDLLRAFQLSRQGKPGVPVRLVLVGEGPERPRLLALCRELGVTDDVTLAGHQDDVRPYYGIADLFVLPSHSEGSPNVLLEAMSAGVPVVATSVGGIPEIVTDEADALLVEKQNVGALSTAISRMLHDADLRDRLRRSGQKAVLRHTPEAFYQSIASVFQEALRN